MTVSFYGHVRQYHNIKAEIDANMQQVLESGNYVMGPALKRFEKELAEYHGMKYAIGVGNGTDALWLSFMALGIGPGDECITTTNTFFATAEAIWIAGATAVFVDSDAKTNCIDPAKIEAAITPRTKALVPVHLYGQCADMAALRKIADKHKLLVIEDNAQAIGAAGKGFKIGELSDAVCTSFIIQKNLGCFGDGGAVVTNHEKVDREVRRMRNHGSEKRSCHSYGFNSRLDDLHAAVLSAKLKHIDEWNDNRRSGPPGTRPVWQAQRASRCPMRCLDTGTFSISMSSKLCRRSTATNCWLSSTRTVSTPSVTTRSRFISRKAMRGANKRASPAPFPTPSAMRPPASPCRCSPN
jgi:dTDP-4-amino-4,6-dideoxygalactose transaminase